MGDQMEDQERLLLTEREAAQLLAMSTHFLRRDRISNSSVGIPYLRIGAAVRYRRSDLEEWIERKMQL
jgi:excisionase family DNA binding protein